MGQELERWWRRRLTGLLEPLRRWFEDRRERHTQLRRHLNQARIGVTYDDYLTRISVTAVGGAVATAVLTLVVLQAVTYFLGADVTGAVVDAGIALAVGAATGLLAWGVGYTRPRRIARQRARKLDVALPGMVTYLYALTHGGMDVVEVIRRSADHEDIYGEQAREMQAVVNEMDYFGTDLVTALQNIADLTPCAATEDFLSDLVGVLESGGDVEQFLAERHENYVDDLTSEQAAYLETVGLFAELYVTVLVAGPLFVIILLLVIGILGSSTLVQVYLLVYVGLPLGTVFALLALDYFSSPLAQTDRSSSDPTPEAAVPDDPDAQAYAKQKRRREWWDRLRHPVEGLVAAPMRSLYLTVPAAALAVALVALSGLVTPSVATLRSRPLTATALLGVLPFLVVTVPLTGLYELKRRFTERVRERLPDILASLARANRTGIQMVEALSSETERSRGIIADELTKLERDIRWFSDPGQAFRRLAARARLQITTRTLLMVAEASEVSGDIQRTLTVAADDARFQRNFARERVREVSTYIAVAVISFLVFLGILLLVQQFYLERVVAAGAAAAPTGTELPGSLQSVDAPGFRLAFLHASMIQGGCIGLIAGKLSRGTALAGVKYSILMVVVSLVAFGVV